VMLFRMSARVTATVVCCILMQILCVVSQKSFSFRDAPISCNFVNVYTIVYHVQYTCTRAHPKRTSSRGKAGQKSADKSDIHAAERASRGRPREPDTPTSGEEVRVGVGPVEFKL